LVALVAVDTLIVALLAFLVVGLLRSQGEILRRLGTPAPSGSARQTTATGQSPDGRHRMSPDIPGPRSEATPVFDISGSTLSGDRVKISLATGVDTLLAFLSSGCLPCQALWHGMRPDAWTPLPNDARLVVVTKDASFESPSKLRELSTPGVRVVMSTEAWDNYKIDGSPYFIYASGDGSGVLSEGSAISWDQVRSLLRDALADYELTKAQALAEERQEV
jgi:hypothetical protein